MKPLKNDWLLSIGLFTISITLILTNLFNIPDFLGGLGLGIGIGLELLSIIKAKYGLTKIRNFKKKCLKRLVG